MAVMRLRQDAIDHLNRAFYEAAPYEHLDYRLGLILGEVDTMRTLPETETFRRFRKVMSQEAAATEEPDGAKVPAEHEADDDLSMNLDEHRTIDSVMLACQAGETLLRMHLAHLAVRDGSAQGAWLAVSDRSNAAQFRNDVSGLATKTITDLHADVEWLYVGSRDQLVTEDTAVGDLAARIDHAVDTAAEWIRFFSRQYLDLGPLYNAAKHGLAVVSGHHVIEFHPESPSTDVPSLPLAKGATVQFLEQPPKGEDSRRRWVRTMHVMDVPSLLATVYAASGYLRGLWGVARCRYAGSERAELFLPTQLGPRSLRTEASARIRLPLNYVPLSGGAPVQFLATRGH